MEVPNEIEPCPICGSSLKGKMIEGRHGKEAVFACEDCGFTASLPIIPDYESAIKQYNKEAKILRKGLDNGMD